MKVPLLDLRAQLSTVEVDVKRAVLRVIDSTNYILGEEVASLEREVASYCGVKHAVGVSSGTDALLVALMALDVGPNDIVITTPYSFFASVGVIARLGAKPAFIDIHPSTYNMNPQGLEKWFHKNRDVRARVKAILPIHLFGQMARLDDILEIASKFGVPVVEDAAQALGATYPSSVGTRKAGSMGLMGCFSFFPSKNLGAMGDAGAVTTNDPVVDEKIRKLRVHGSKPKYYHALVGGNFRLDPIQAAILLAKFPHLESWHEKRRANASYYDTGLAQLPVERPEVSYERSNHIYNQYVIGVGKRRDELRSHLSENGIGNEVYYPVPLHLQECFRYLGFRKGDFPVSEEAALSSVALPIYPELTREMQDYVITAISEFYE